MSKYIDRDMAEQALIKEAALILRKMPYITIADSLDRMIKIVQEVPAADVAPVVHGRWQSYESSRYVGVDGKGNPKYRNIRIYYCSQCGHCSIIRTKGCPNCRAKMDKEETNELDQCEG